MIWTLILLGLAAAGAYYIYHSSSQQESQESDYQPVPVKSGEIHVTILSTGVVEPENRLDIKATTAGRIDELLVKEGEKVRVGQTLALTSTSERAALLDAAKAKGPEVLEEWKNLFKPTSILAPISGTIIKRNVVSGQTFTPNDPIYTMSDRLLIMAQVDETDIGKISLEQRVLIVLDAYPDVQTLGTVEQIAFDATTVNNVTTYDVKILPQEIPQIMRSGMTANVTFEVESKSNIPVIPVGAVTVKNEKSYVRVPSQKAEEPAKEIAIETGITDGKQIEVLSGISIGDMILAPKFKLGDGDFATNPFSPFNRSSQKKRPQKK